MHKPKKTAGVKLTIEQLSKLTKLSVPTIRVYVTRKKLGTKVGRSRVFSQADVQKLLATSKGTGATRKAKPAGKKVSAGKRPPRAAQTRKGPTQEKRPEQEKAAAKRAEEPGISASKKQGFWSSLFGARQPKKKVNLLDVKTPR